MQKYELLLILPGTLDDKEVATRSAEIVTLVKEYASDVDLQAMGKNRLAYPIKQIRYGYFFTATFMVEVPQLKKLEERLSLTRDILRAVITHYNTGITAAQKVAYSTDSTGVTIMVEKNASWAQKKMPAMAMVAPMPLEVPDDSLARKAGDHAGQMNMEEISKKLDDLMSGDAIPGA